MIALPLIYVALIAAVGFATYWHATKHTWLTDYRSFNRWAYAARLIGYAGPIFCGLTLVFFMLKPIFAR